MKRGLIAWIAIPALIFESACLVGPNYKRPKVDVPATYRGPDESAVGTPDEQSLGDAKWSAVFDDPVLQNLIETALKQNFNVRIAASRIEQARAQVVVTRSNQFPSVSGLGEDTGLRTPPIGGGFPSFAYNALEIGLSGSWNIDFWGRYRRATEAARASLLSYEWARRAVLSSLVANVASDYFALREIDLQLDIARRTLASRRESVQLTQALVEGGSSPLTDQRQAEQLVETAAATIPDLERQAQLEENSLRILLGENPGPIARGRPLTEQPLPPTIPAGLPSRLLERRPDIREAEQNLVAANAEIGVARAAFFPTISLTGTVGFESASLEKLFTRANQRAWNYTASATQPIFTAGQLRGNLRIAQELQQQSLFTYQQTIQQAFSDVSNALIGYRKFREYREHEERLVAAARDASDLSHTRFQGGVTSYLEVLTNETNLFSAELSLAGARLNERLSVVQVYNALGSGWQ